MKLNRSDIACRVPHAGTMSLLESVTTWDARHISCIANVPGTMHPLTRDGMLPAVAAVEYAAQATAVHGALLDNKAAPRAGMLAKLSEIELHTECISDDCWPLNVRAELLSGGASGVIYAFEVGGADQPIASGRLTVVFSSSAAP